MHLFCNSEIIFLNTTQILSQRITLSTKKYWRAEVQDSYKHRVTKSSNIFCSICPSAGAEAKRFLQSKNPTLEHLSQILMLVLATGYFGPCHESRKNKSAEELYPKSLPACCYRKGKERIYLQASTYHCFSYVTQ